MLLYIVRHADALPGANDDERPLSQKGVKDAMKLASFLKDRKISVAHVYHSGLKRAIETAELVAKGLTPKVKTEHRQHLRPEDPVKLLCDGLEAETEDLMIVGHNPSLTLAASRLVLGSEDLDFVDFKKGALLVLEHNAGRWLLKWFIPPKLL